jgi:hypothetical protein
MSKTLLDPSITACPAACGPTLGIVKQLIAYAKIVILYQHSSSTADV